MAVKLIKKPTDYMSEMSYVYDVAKTSQYFDKSVYDSLSGAGNQEDVKQYLYGVAGAKDIVSDAFDKDDYSYLTSAEDKAAYTVWALYGDKTETVTDETTGETYNLWEKQKEYFDQQIQAGIDKEIFDNMSGFEKTMNTIGGVVGNALNSVYGMLENILDLGTLAIGGIGTGFGLWDEGWEGVKKAAAYDLTGTGAIQNALDEYSRKNTYIGKNKFATFVNDVASGVAQFSVNFIPVVGTAAYWTSMYGGAVSDAVQANPDIDYFTLMLYGAAVTGSEFAIETISGKLLGGSGTLADKLLTGAKGKTLTKFGKFASKSGLTRILSEAVSEGMEESVGEFWEVALWNFMVAQNDKSLVKTADIKDIVYAGLVGGTIGGLMSGGRMATQRNLVKLTDGRIVTEKYAKENNLDISEKFSKSQSMSINEQLQQLQTLTQTSQVADLRTKYEGLTDAQIQEQHETEWKEATEYDELLAKDIVATLDILSKIHSILGDEKFKKITDIANETYDTIQALGDAYIADVRGESEETQLVTNALRKIYGDGVSAVVNKSISPSMRRLIQNLRNLFGIKAYSVNIGELPGEQGKLSLAISEDTVLLDPKVFGTMSEQEILLKLVRHELAHTLQFDKDIIKPETLVAVQLAMSQNTDVIKSELDAAYAKESTLTKLTEAQANALAESLLFDNLTVAKLFYSEYDTLTKVYKKLKRIKKEKEESGKLRQAKEKLSYHELLTVMKAYREIAALKAGTEHNINEIKSDWALSPEEFRILKDAYFPNEEIPPIKKGEFLQVAAFAQMKTNAVYNFLKKKGINPINYNEKGFSPEFIQLLGDVAPSVTTIKEMLNETISENETAIGTASATNLIIEFLYKNNKNIKSIEDITALTEKDKKGYSPLAYSYVYAAKHSPKEGVKITYISEEAEAAAKKAQDPKTPHTKQEVRFDVALKMENGKRVYDKDKLKLKEFELKEAQQIIDDAIAQNVLNTKLLNLDFDFSINASTNLFKTLETDYEQLSADETEIAKGFTGSTDSLKKTFNALEKATIQRERMENQKLPEGQFAVIKSEEGDELGGEEFVVDEASNVENIVLERMGESVEDTATFMDNLPKIIETYQQGFEDWLLRSGKGDKQGNELDDIQRVVTNIKQLEKSSEKIKISAKNRDLIEQITQPEFLIASVKNVVTVENSKAIKKKLENNKKKLVNMYAEKGYKLIQAAATVDTVVEKSPDTVVEKSPDKKQTVRDLFTDKETGELRLPDMSPEEMSEARKNIKNNTAMANVMIDDTFKSNVDLAKKIKSLFTLTKESKYQGDGDEANRLYFRAAKKIVSENAALFVQITPKNYYEVRKALMVDGDKQARVALEMVDEYAKIHKHKFASIEQQIEEIHHEEITSAARRMGLWSNTLKEAAPISSFVDGLRSEGVDYNVDDKTLNAILAKHNEKLKTPQKYLIELKSNYDALDKELKNMANEQNPSPERQVEISQDLVRLDNEIMVLEKGSALEIMDYYVNNSDSLTQRHAIQQEAFEAIFESAIEMDEDLQTELETNRERNKKYKDYPELFPKLNKKIKKIVSAMEHFRITAMLSSPITWVRNAINNRLLYGLAKSTDFIESKINETAKFKKLYSHPGQYKLVTSASEKAEYKQTRTYLIDNYYDYIFAWLGSTQNKMDTSSVSAEISRTKTKVQQRTGNLIAKAIGAVEDIIYKNLETGKLGDRPMTTKYMLEGMANILTANKAKYVEAIKALYGDAERINRSKSLSAEQKKKLITALDTQTPTDLFEAISILPEVFEEFLQISSSRALETFLKNDTAFSRLLRNVSKQNIFAKVAIGLINPFYKVGGNVLAMAWKYSPANFINAIMKLKRAEMVTSEGYVGKYTGTETAEASRAFAQSTVGSALWIAGIIAAALGWIDVDEDEYMGPYVNFLGVKIGLSDLAPAMTTFSVGAVMMKSWKDKKIFDMDLFLRVMYSNTLLGNVENIFKYRSEMDFFSSLSINYITSYIPAVFKLTAKIFDDGIKDKSGNWMSKLWKTILASLPGVSRTVPNKINPYTGEQQTRYGTDDFIQNLIGAISPVEISFESKNMSNFEKEAIALKTETTGMSGSFTINDKDYKLTDETKEKYSAYKAQYINNRFNDIFNGNEKVTLKDENTGEYKTVKYDTLNNDEKQRVLKNLYSTGTTITKIQYWLDQGNSYVVTDRDQYREYKKLFGNSANIIYRNKWSGSKFVEG